MTMSTDEQKWFFQNLLFAFAKRLVSWRATKNSHKPHTMNRIPRHGMAKKEIENCCSEEDTASALRSGFSGSSVCCVVEKVGVGHEVEVCVVVKVEVGRGWMDWQGDWVGCLWMVYRSR